MNAAILNYRTKLEDAVFRAKAQEVAQRADSQLMAEIRHNRENPSEMRCAIEYPMPPGQLGKLSELFYGASIKKIRQYAIAEAVTTAAGVFGRAYNVSGTGLNTYLMVLGASGTGKSHLSKNPEWFMTYLERQHGVIDATNFVMTKRFTHENAMFQEFSERSSFCQCLSEFGKIFNNMMSQDSKGGSLATVREAMTDIYSKSGQFDRVGGLRYTNADKSVNIPYSVAYSFLGESVPEPFYGALTVSAFTDGFMSRFLCVEYNGEIPYDTVPSFDVPAQLAEHWKNATLGVIQALQNVANPSIMNVGFCHKPFTLDTGEVRFTEDVANAYSKDCTDNANNTDDPIEKSLWTRANLKALKLAALAAVADNPSAPVIEWPHLEWAIAFVAAHNEAVLHAHRRGEFADEEIDPSCQLVLDEVIDHLRLALKGKNEWENDSNSLEDLALLAQKGIVATVQFSQTQRLTRKLAKHNVRKLKLSVYMKQIWEELVSMQKVVDVDRETVKVILGKEPPKKSVYYQVIEK